MVGALIKYAANIGSYILACGYIEEGQRNNIIEARMIILTQVREVAAKGEVENKNFIEISKISGSYYPRPIKFMLIEIEHHMRLAYLKKDDRSYRDYLIVTASLQPRFTVIKNCIRDRNWFVLFKSLKIGNIEDIFGKYIDLPIREK